MIHGDQVIEVLAERTEDGGWLVRSPRVGIYRDRPRAGGHRATGDGAGRLAVLNRVHDLVLPAGVDGVVTAIHVHDRRVPVEHGQPLFTLAPASLTGAVTAAPAPGPGPSQDGAAGASLPEGCHAMTSPLDGVFYRRPSPTAPPFVETGSIVETGRTIGLIEAMKSFNAVGYGGGGLPLRAEVVEVRAADASEVRQGAILLVVRPAAAE